jgi:3-oxoadipate enol-lactonase
VRIAIAIVSGTDPVALSYRRGGKPGASPIVFVHGLGASSRVWEDQARRLGDGHTTICIDLRGHGESPTRDRACSRSELAADLVAVLDREGLADAVLVGHSAGGVVAMQTAVDFPARVRALVLVGTASECNDKTAAWYDKTADASAAEGGEAGMRAMGMKPGKDPVPDGPGLAHLCRAMRTLNTEPLTDALRGLRVPALIIVGEKDFLGVGGSVILSRAIADSELEIVAGRGHAIYDEAPEWFAERVRRFLDTRSLA